MAWCMAWRPHRQLGLLPVHPMLTMGTLHAPLPSMAHEALQATQRHPLANRAQLGSGSTHCRAEGVSQPGLLCAGELHIRALLGMNSHTHTALCPCSLTHWAPLSTSMPVVQAVHSQLEPYAEQPVMAAHCGGGSRERQARDGGFSWIVPG